MSELEDVLHALSAADIKTLAKSYHVQPTVTLKGQLVQELMKKSTQSTLGQMFGSKSGGVAMAMVKKWVI